MSGEYTAQALPEADRLVATHLHAITGAVVSLLGKDLEAIVLGGGFGRGEGSVAVGPEGRMHIVNDYDIEVIYRNRWGRWLTALWAQLRYRRRLEALAERLAHELEVKQVDLALRDPGFYARTTTARLADYDLKTGHKLLWGECDPLAGMRDFHPRDIPPFEGTWLLRSRGNGLLLARLYLRDAGLADRKREYFTIELNKAVLAMGDAFFILAGCYHNSYAVRAQRIHEAVPDTFARAAELRELYRRAAAYKLDPRNGFPVTDDPLASWTRIAELYLDCFLHIESRRTGREFGGVLEYGDRVLAGPAPAWRRRIVEHAKRAVVRVVSGRPPTRIPLRLRHDRPVTVFFTFLLLACHLRGERRLLAALSGLIRATGDIDRARLEDVTRDFLLLTHPQGEQGRYLTEEYAS